MIICSECGHSNPADASACETCGRSLNGGNPRARTTRPLDSSTVDMHQVFEPFEAGQKTFGEESRLVLNMGEDGQRAFFLPDGDEITFGRGADNTVSVSDQRGWEVGLSWRHATIRREGDSIYVIDLGSTNGTFINNEPVPPNTPFVIHDGDILRLSLLDMRVRFFHEQ